MKINEIDCLVTSGVPGVRYNMGCNMGCGITWGVPGVRYIMGCSWGAV